MAETTIILLSIGIINKISGGLRETEMNNLNRLAALSHTFPNLILFTD